MNFPSVTEVTPDGPGSLRACLLSGGNSERMGTDKGQLIHPHGGNWLSHSLLLLAKLRIPITVLSQHPAHLSQARSMATELGTPLQAIEEPAPREGPLLALGRLMQWHGGDRLLLCPVDMPWLQESTLMALAMAAERCPGRIHIAHDGTRPQPLLGIYPASRAHRQALAAVLAAGDRRLMGWIEAVGFEAVPLPANSLRNANRPRDLRSLEAELDNRAADGIPQDMPQPLGQSARACSHTHSATTWSPPSPNTSP
jgi:molybdopterin-guanine dinucleotide biosynthesis protein A